MRIDIDGYFFFEDLSGNRYLMIDDEDDTVFDYIREKGIKNIMLSEIGGCSGENLDFLAEDYQFEKVYIFFKTPVDISKLSHQTSLKELSLSDVLFDLDYNLFPELESLSLVGQKKEIPPFNKQNKLKYININGFLKKDLTFLQHCTNLEQLVLVYGRRMNTLSGLENTYNSLIQLELLYLSKLTSLWNVDPNTVLKRLFFENSPNLKDISELQNAQKLELLSIHKCKELKSLRFMDQLPHLNKAFLEKTKISDGYIPGYVQIV